MAKLKTNKAARKRFKITATKKLLIRRGGQDHFNARQRGAQILRKRRDHTVSGSEVKSVRRVIPYS